MKLFSKMETFDALTYSYYSLKNLLQNTRVSFSRFLKRLFGHIRFLSGSIHWEHLRFEPCVQLTSLNITGSLFLDSVGELSLKTLTLTHREYTDQ